MLVVISSQSPKSAIHPRLAFAYQTLATAAEHEGMDLLVIPPTAQLGSVSALVGCRYDEVDAVGVWHEQSHPAKRTVYFDFMYLSDIRANPSRYRLLMRSLRQHARPVFNPPMPPKDHLFQILSQSSPSTDGQIPKTFQEISAESAIRILEQVPKLWIKPVHGSGGRNSLYVERRKSNQFLVVAEQFFGQTIVADLNRRELLQLLSMATRRSRYLGQVHVPLLQTADKRTVDIRVTLVRNRCGAWEIVSTTGRSSQPDSLLTNYHAGGKVVSLTERTEESVAWLLQSHMSDDDISRAHRFGLTVAEKLQATLPHLAILGVDIGQTTDGQQYVYDCNARPGRDILTNSEIAHYLQRVVAFAHWLEEQSYGLLPNGTVCDQSSTARTASSLCSQVDSST